MSGYVRLTCKYHKEGRRWVAFCEELGTSTFGRTLDEAERRLEEAITLHLNTLEDVGERERFFSENNIVFHRTRPTGAVTVQVPSNSDYFVRSCVWPLRELATA